MRLRALSLFLLALAASAAAQDDPIHAGPMLGPVTHREALVWVQTSRPAEVQLRYYVERTAEGITPRARPLMTPPVLAGPQTDHVALFPLTGLEPGWTYGYQVLVDGEEVALPRSLRFTTQPLWQWRTDPPAFTAALGSCAYVNDPPYDRPGDPYGGGYEIFESIAALEPDLMLWLGDNTYLREVDWESPPGLAYRYAHTRALPELQPLLATAAHYATWDDHDYGPNDSDRSYVLKDAALATFYRYWPSFNRGLPGVPGVFTHFRWADVEFFLLDDRYHRSPNRAPNDGSKVILGGEQLAWVLDALTASRAPFKVVAMGGQILTPEPRPGSETYLTIAPEERQRLLDGIAERGIEGVVLLSGDVHHTQLMRMEREGAYPLYEFTSSPLTAGPAPERYAQPNAFTVEGTFVQGRRNFGTMTVEGPRTDRVMTLRTYATDGTLLWEHRIAAHDLRLPEAD